MHRLWVTRAASGGREDGKFEPKQRKGPWFLLDVFSKTKKGTQKRQNKNKTVSGELLWPTCCDTSVFFRSRSSPSASREIAGECRRDFWRHRASPERECQGVPCRFREASPKAKCIRWTSEIELLYISCPSASAWFSWLAKQS